MPVLLTNAAPFLQSPPDCASMLCQIRLRPLRIAIVVVHKLDLLGLLQNQQNHFQP